MMFPFQSDSLFRQDSTAIAEMMQDASLYEPSPVPFSFETIGWVILAGVMAIIGMVLIFIGTRNYIRNGYRRTALQRLKVIADGSRNFMEVFVVLKVVAIKSYGREKVARLHGQDWLAFLDKTGKHLEFLDRKEEILGAVYKDLKLSHEAKEKLLSNAKKWVKTHAREF